ncbi:hypothetical protein LXL04_021677 [Taraxacum kok-saghyz]
MKWEIDSWKMGAAVRIDQFLGSFCMNGHNCNKFMGRRERLLWWIRMNSKTGSKALHLSFSPLTSNPSAACFLPSNSTRSSKPSQQTPSQLLFLDSMDLRPCIFRRSQLLFRALLLFLDNPAFSGGRCFSLPDIFRRSRPPAPSR